MQPCGIAGGLDRGYRRTEIIRICMVQVFQCEEADFIDKINKETPAET